MIDLERVKEAALAAGEAILEIYAREFSVEEKEDKSPLTEADRAAHEILVAALEEATPEIPIISEEAKTLPYAERKGWSQLWMIDPLDGTKEFIKKNGEFTINVAFVEDGVPTAGVVYQPTEKKLYFGGPETGAFCQIDGGEAVPVKNEAHYSEKDEVCVVASRSHLSPEVEKFVEDLKAQGKDVEFLSAGSSLKLCKVAEGSADVYPRLAPTMEWDTAAAHAIATAAGRKVLQWESRESLQYNKEDLLNPWFIVE
ncbi:MAG: 3'(2'),5'-bisphosphate nucleotidase CysQ [Verrucomicrobiota bacterium]